jgi:SAM-dependent methyltransferase
MRDAVDRGRVFGEVGGAIERIAPGFFAEAFVAEHLARYRWAIRYITGLKVLDLACGTGYGAGVLRAKACQVVSVDINADALEFGRARYGLHAVRADAEALPFAGGSFGAVVSFETVEHLANPGRFLAELARVLRPDGIVVLSTPNLERSAGNNPYHLNEMSLTGLLGLCVDSGFRAACIMGQHWRLRGSAFARVKGLRRFAWKIQRRPSIGRLPLWLATPEYWCVRLERVR